MLQRIKDSLKVLLGKAKAVPAQDNVNVELFSCPVCKKDKLRFDPLPFYYLRELDKNQSIHSIFQSETMNLEFYYCSNCRSSDRDRMYALYFDKVMKEGSEKKLTVLDIAPAPSLTKFLKDFPNLIVRTADLYMDGVDDKVDLTNMKDYTDESFDIFICSHVLEHIDDDIAAMKELFRVLKKGGWGIAMVPINLALKENYEDNNIKDDDGKWKHFGQFDHVRMYSKSGFTDRLKQQGFTVTEFDVSYFGEEVFRRHGINPRSVLYIASK